MFNTLIVDDSDAFRQTLHLTLERCFPSMSVTEVADGEAALTSIAAHCPDLIFMDIRLPGLSGLDITKIIKSIYTAKICVITSYDLQEYHDAALCCGADYFIVKDKLSITELSEIVEGIRPSH